MAFDISRVWSWLFGGQQSQTPIARTGLSGVTLTAESSLQVTAFLRAARVIAEGISSMPLKLYEETDDESGRTVRSTARKNKSYRPICYQPCWLTRAEFAETMTMHAVVAGDGYAIINRGFGAGASDPVLELLPLMPQDVTFTINKEWEPEYRVAFSGFAQTLKKGEIFHLRGPSWDGRLGISTVNAAREALGLSKALENAHSKLMGTDARPAGVLTTNGAVSPDAAKMIRERWVEAYGPGGTRGVAVLDNGYDFKSIQMNAVDAQFIENRKFQIEEVARATGVFPQMLMHVEKAMTFASSSEFFAAHVKYTLLPWVVKWEEALKRDVLGWDGKNKDVFPRHSMEGLLRAAPKERGEFYVGMLTNGVMSPNEIRALENLNPREGGDEYLTPMNMRQGDDDPADPPDDDKPAPKDPNDEE